MSICFLSNSSHRWGAAVLALTLGGVSCAKFPVISSSAEGVPETADINIEPDRLNIPNVVASYSVLCDMVTQVAANIFEPTCLIRYYQDPHLYEASDDDLKAFEQADVIFYAGLNFEPSISRMVKSTHSPAHKIAVHEESVLNVIRVEEKGVVKSDPHIWHDVANGIRMVELIEKTLSEIDPANAEIYLSNAADLIQELEQLDVWIFEQITTIPENHRSLITTHDSMRYYAKTYGLSIEETLFGLSTAEKATAAQVKTVSEAIKSRQVPTIFLEQTKSASVLRRIANEAGVNVSNDVLMADGIGQSETSKGSYQEMLIYNTCAIVEGLGGVCAPFEMD